MAYKIGKVEVWAGDMVNRPGMLARVLEALSNAGADLEFVVARRVTANTSRVFVAPLTSAAQRRAAGDVGLMKASGMYALRIEGPDRAGLGARLTRAIADAGINMRGLSSAAVARKSVCYMAFASEDESRQAARIVKKTLSSE